jgi:hypothetical protein
MKAQETIEYSLGEYIGEYICNSHLPSLGIDGMTRKTISITWGESKEYERLHSNWHRKYNSKIKGAGQKEWNEYLKFRYKLKEKYLPHILECNIPVIPNHILSSEENKSKIIDGLIRTLWDSDVCEYSLEKEDIAIYTRTYYKFPLTTVTLKLDLNKPNSYTGKDWIEINPQN